MKKSLILALCVLGLVLTSCSDSGMKSPYQYETKEAINAVHDSEPYLELNETGYIATSTNNKVRISMDTSNAVYANIRRMINNNQTVDRNAVNIE